MSNETGLGRGLWPRPIRRRALWIGLAGIVLLAIGIAAPDTLAIALGFAAGSFVATLPVMLGAVAVTAWIQASNASGIVTDIFAGSPVRMIVAAAFVGALTPICGVGVLPIIAGLLQVGVPLAPVMAFWLSSPVTDPAMLTITAGTLGLDFAIGKTAIAFGIGLAGGLLTMAMVRAGAFADPCRATLAQHAGHCDAGACDSSSSGGFRWNVWSDDARAAIFWRSARDSALLIGKWLAIAFVAEGLLRQFLPTETVVAIAGADNRWAIPLAVLIGTPIYLDGYAALPLVRGLVDLGMTPGAAMALLVSGGITSLYASVAVWALVKPPVFLWYLALAMFGALAGGYLYQAAI
ncbi:MAG: permease [Dongiaceae bacterium]